VLFAPGETVVHALVLAGSNARQRSCTADWSKQGDHPLARGVFVGPTYFVTYGVPLKGVCIAFEKRRSSEITRLNNRVFNILFDASSLLTEGSPPN